MKLSKYLLEDLQGKMAADEGPYVGLYDIKNKKVIFDANKYASINYQSLKDFRKEGVLKVMVKEVNMNQLSSWVRTEGERNGWNQREINKTIKDKAKTASAPKKDRWGLINAQGESITDFKQAEVGEFVEGLMIFKRGGKYGMMNVKGEVVVKPKYKLLERLSRDEKKGSLLIMYTLGEKKGLMNNKGKRITNPKYDEIDDMESSADRIAVGITERDMLWGFVDNLGNEVISPKYTEIVSGFRGSKTALVERTKFYANGGERIDKWRIDKDGNVIKKFKPTIYESTTTTLLDVMNEIEVK